jgi:hypothetical protein
VQAASQITAGNKWFIFNKRVSKPSVNLIDIAKIVGAL